MSHQATSIDGSTEGLLIYVNAPAGLPGDLSSQRVAIRDAVRVRPGS